MGMEIFGYGFGCFPALKIFLEQMFSVKLLQNQRSFKAKTSQCSRYDRISLNSILIILRILRVIQFITQEEVGNQRTTLSMRVAYLMSRRRTHAALALQEEPLLRFSSLP